MFWFLIVPKLSANAMALYPFIILRDKAQQQDLVLVNHEKIHLKQQLELLIIPFYFFYLLNYLVNLIKYKNHYQAYYNIVFEKEAYQLEKDLNYLPNRKIYSWINFFR